MPPRIISAIMPSINCSLLLLVFATWRLALQDRLTGSGDPVLAAIGDQWTEVPHGVAAEHMLSHVATVVLDPQGAAVVALPAGKYVVQPQRAAGLMGTAAPANVTVVDGTLTPVVLAYDTGMR